MKFIISGKNIEVTPGLKDAIEQKLGKLERYFTPETEINVTLSVEKGRQKIEVTIPVKGNIIRSEQTSNDMYVSIDLVEEIIERQLRKYKNKLVARNQGHPTSYAPSGNSFRKEFFDSEEETTEDDEVRIVRTKKFGIKPMTARLKSYVPKNSDLNLCIQKMRVFRWNFSDITSSYSPMPRLMKSM